MRSTFFEVLTVAMLLNFFYTIMDPNKHAEFLHSGFRMDRCLSTNGAL